ncbi:MAG TPA: helix-turn-helix domain-containing protein [Egibacteraceae bacterium]|nr:helix-turn-helix domain-containing protein [Egibacteraceae bacterium]
MKRTSFEHWQCSIAQTVEVVGDWWSILILRDVFWGLHRFDELLEDLGIARNILSDRLSNLVAKGVLEKVPYQQAPVRHEYRLTKKGRDLWPVLMMMAQWGDRWSLEGTHPIEFEHTACGERVHAVLSCDHCGERLGGQELRMHFNVSREAASGKRAS